MDQKESQLQGVESQGIRFVPVVCVVEAFKECGEIKRFHANSSVPVGDVFLNVAGKRHP